MLPYQHGHLSKPPNEDTTTGKAFRKVNKESALLDHLISLTFIVHYTKKFITADHTPLVLD
jgi:hypothetical protein